MDLWKKEGNGLYTSPLNILRQEWFHGNMVIRRCPAFFDRLKQSEVIFDYGCGTGEAYRLDWIEKGGKIIMADVEGPGLEYAKAKYKDLPNVKVVKITDIPKRYDALICIDVLEHINNPMDKLAELWKGLKPSGHALLWFDHSYPHPGHLKQSIDQIPQYDFWRKTKTKIIYDGMYDWVQKPQTLGGLCHFWGS